MICLLGFGEVGQVLAEDFSGKGFTAWDLKFADPAADPARALAGYGLVVPASAHDAVSDADVIISAVTAAQDEAAARSVAGGLGPGSWFMDVNSAAPAQKQAAARVIAAAGGRYVEAVIMSPIGTKRIASPMLLGGPHAQAFLPVVQGLGFSGASVFSAEIGPASATKLCRSIIIKGLEALLTESMLAARHYGVEHTVLASLSDFFPGQDWEKLARYMIERGLQHGTRRAEEMREAAATVAAAGLEPSMSDATAARQDWAAGHRAALQAENLEAMLDRVLQDMKTGDTEKC